MKCTPIRVGNATAIVCGSARLGAVDCSCGERATRECDWIVLRRARRTQVGRRNGRPKTCDAPLCPNCAYSPAPDKDLCAAHAALWAVDPRNPNRKESPP